MASAFVVVVVVVVFFSFSCALQMSAFYQDACPDSSLLSFGRGV
jgi:hypothetical protein